MKTILNILIILLVAVTISGAFTLIVDNTSIASGPDGEGGQPPAITSTDGQTSGERPARPEGGGEGGTSIGAGLLGVLTSLAKLTGITVLVLLVEKGFNLFGKRTLKPVQG